MNSRKHQKAVVTGGSFLGLVALVVVALGFGIVHVHFVHEQNRIGTQIRKVEDEIRKLNYQNKDLESEIANLSNRDVLAKKVGTGVIDLQPIADSAVRRLRGTLGSAEGQTVASIGPLNSLQTTR